MNFSSGCRDSSGVKPLSLGGLQLEFQLSPDFPEPGHCQQLSSGRLGAPCAGGAQQGLGAALSPALHPPARSGSPGTAGWDHPRHGCSNPHSHPHLPGRKGWVPRVAPGGSCRPYKAAAPSGGWQGARSDPRLAPPCRSGLAAGGRKPGLGSILSPLWISSSRARGHWRWSRP